MSVLNRKSLAWITILAFLTGCVSSSNSYNMDEATRTHPATEKFLAFKTASKTEASYDSLLKDFYTPRTQTQIAKLKGWYKLAYSSAHRFLKDGECQTITLTPKHSSRVQIDCTGPLTVNSFILGSSEETGHLRVFMIRHGEQWYLDKAGYVHTNSTAQTVTYGRFGLRFDSSIESP